VSDKSKILYLLLFLGIAVGVFYYRKLNSAFKYLIILLICVLITEVGSKIIPHYGFNKNPLYILFSILHYPIFSYIYYQFLSKKKDFKIHLLVTAFLYYFFVVLNIIYLQPVTIFPSNIILVESVFILSQILYLFYDMLHHPIQKPLTQQGMFWVNSGSLFFYSSTFIIFGFFNYFKKYQFEMNWAYFILWLTNIIMYSCYLIAIIVEGKNKTKEIF